MTAKSKGAREKRTEARFRSFTFMIALLLVAAAAPLVAAQHKRDVVFIVDGSSSIDDADFALQKAGINAAIRKPDFVPLDASIQIAVVQFSDSARVELEAHLVEDAADIDFITNNITGMIQLHSGTGPGHGIREATKILRRNARDDASQSFCLSTDGKKNTGPVPDQLLEVAQATANFKLESFSVVAIEDPGMDHFAEDFEEEYGHLTFGTGDLVVVQNSAEFANMVGALCFHKKANSVKLVGLEVVQVVQDLENSVKLIADKETQVRAYFEPVRSGVDSVAVLPRLHGYHIDGRRLNKSPTVADNKDNAIIAEWNIVDKRRQKNSSAIFELPQQWTAVGKIRLVVEVVGGELECQDAAWPTKDDCETTVEFLDTNKLKVNFMRIIYSKSSTGERFVPTTSDVLSLETRLVAMLPVAEIDSKSTRLQLDDDENQDIDAVLRKIQTHGITECNSNPDDCDRIFYGAVASDGELLDSDGEEILGATLGHPGSAATASVGIVNNKMAFGRFTHVHEMCHCFGCLHPRIAQANAKCDESTAHTDPDFPFVETIGQATAAAIGPTSQGKDKLVFGWDSERRAIIDYRVHFALMSYCDGGQDKSRWISTYTYHRARAFIQANFRTDRSSTKSVLTGHVCVVSGTIKFSTGETKFHPTLRLFSEFGIPTDAGSPRGSYSLIARNELGHSVNIMSFEPVPAWKARVNDTAANAASTPIGTFLVLVAGCDDKIKSFEVESPDRITLADLTASANAPVVSVIYPNGGELLSGDTVDFQWSSKDADGDALFFLVEYSRDDGTSWTTLAVDHSGSSLTVSLSELDQTNTGRIRVTASDGFHSTSDTSDGIFTTPNNPPVVQILNPLEEGSRYFGVQTLHLRAAAVDPEDGKLEGWWRSDRNGTIGYANQLEVYAFDLVEGQHILTFEATDSGGDTTSDSVAISISRIGDPQPTAAPTISAPPTRTHAPTNTCRRENERCKTSANCCGSTLGCHSVLTNDMIRRCQPCFMLAMPCLRHTDCCGFPNMARCDQARTMTCKECEGELCVLCKDTGKKCKTHSRCCSMKCRMTGHCA